MTRWLDKFRLRLRSLFDKGRVERELSNELRFHLERQIEENRAKGMSETKARAAAMREFGGVEQVEEECRDVRGVRLVEATIQDILYGLRQLRGNRGFAMVAILTLAIGIGANTALFSVIDGVLLNPLPYPRPSQLVVLGEARHNLPYASISYPNFLDWARMNHSFQALAAYREDDFALNGPARAEHVKVMQVSAGFFRLLGVKPIFGRNFSPADDTPGATPVALLSYGFWKRRFGGSQQILGKTIAMDGEAFSVIGVVPRNFFFCCEWTNFRPGDVYVPFGWSKSDWIAQRENHPGILAVGRLKAGVSLGEARADMDGVARELAALYPDADKGAGVVLFSLREDMVRKVRPILFALLAAVAFVLLIACVNVASLLLARSSGRSREFATRVALGATRGRVVRQLLTESVLLAGAGGVAGLLFAFYGTRAALGVLPEALPRVSEVRLDAPVLFLALFVSVFAGILFGLAPALKASRPDLYESLKEGGRGASGERHRLQAVFVVVEMALAVVLLVGAGLAIRSLARLWSVNPGFNAKNVLTFQVALPPLPANEKPERIHALLRDLTQTVAAVPGVEAASLDDGAQPMISDSELPFWVDGQAKPATLSQMPVAVTYVVSPDYLKVMRIPLLRGRFFETRDLAKSLAAVIDEDFARKYFQGEDPIGRRIDFGDNLGSADIIGVIAHVNQWNLAQDAGYSVTAQVYLLASQLSVQLAPWLTGSAGLVVRTETPNYPGKKAIRDAIARRNSSLAPYDFLSMDRIVSHTLAGRRFLMILLSAFAAVALLLASIGIYGVMSYVAGRRMHEMAIRMALGARPGEVLRLVLWQGARVALGGVAIGIVGALGLTRLMSSLLYGVSTTDPLTFAAVAALLMVVALAACYAPAQRAMRVDPMKVLRNE